MDLKKKVGPFPTYVWIGVATVAVLSAYLYLRKGSGSGSADMTGDTGVGTGGVLDPTNGQPYAGSVGDTGASLGSTPASGAAPDLTSEVNDVLGLLGMFQNAGFFAPAGSQATDQPGYDDTNVVGAINSLAASLQMGSNHDAPPGPGERKATIIRPSAEHGGQLWEYRVGQSGKPIPVGKAPKGAKATTKTAAKSGSSTSGAKTAPKSGSSGSSAKTVSVKGHGTQKVGSHLSIKGKGTYRVNSNGTLTKV